MTPEQILVPFDFSSQTEHALDYAITLAHLFGARMLLLHVVHTSMFGGSPLGNDSTMTAYVARVKADAQQAITSVAERVRDMGIDCHSIVVEGTPFQTICDQARDHQADLIVMGSHGQSGRLTTLLGSVAERVVHLAPCSVFVVRETGTTSVC